MSSGRSAERFGGGGWGADSSAPPREPERSGEGRGANGVADRSAARMRAWPVALLAFAVWFLGGLPWILTRSTTGTFGTPWNPRNHLREALLPFHYQRLPLLLTVVIVAGALSGLAPFWYRERLGRRWLMASLAMVGALSATAYAVWQSVGPGADAVEWVRSLDVEQLGCSVLTCGGSLLGLLLGLAVSLGTPALRTLSASVLVVVVSGWLGAGVVAVVGPSAFSWLPSAVVVFTGLVTGVVLAGLGIRPRRRLLVWAGACILLVLTPAALTASRYVLEGLRGTQTRSDAVAELVGDGLEIFWRSATTMATALVPTSPVSAVAIALVVGAVGAGLLARTRETQAARAASQTAL